MTQITTQLPLKSSCISIERGNFHSLSEFKTRVNQQEILFSIYRHAILELVSFKRTSNYISVETTLRVWYRFWRPPVFHISFNSVSEKTHSYSSCRRRDFRLEKSSEPVLETTTVNWNLCWIVDCQFLTIKIVRLYIVIFWLKKQDTHTYRGKRVVLLFFFSSFSLHENIFLSSPLPLIME